MMQFRFPGQQSDERVLYELRPHIYALYVGIAKVLALAAVLFVVLLMLTRINSLMLLFALLLPSAIALVGSWVVYSMFHKNITFITDRRVIRFEAATPFATNTRSLTWDEVAKVKTFPRNMFWKMMMIGTVVIHASSTYVHTHEQTRENTYTNDDLDLEYVYYYKDLGHYVDKILHMYKHQPSELESIKPFVPKPFGQRD